MVIKLCVRWCRRQSPSKSLIKPSLSTSRIRSSSQISIWQVEVCQTHEESSVVLIIHFWTSVLVNVFFGWRVMFWHITPSKIEIQERFESKDLRMIVDAPWYVPNTVIRRDLQTPTVKEEIRSYNSQYSARLSAHPNALIVNYIELPDNRRLRRHLPNDLPTRFIMQLLYM
jgi:hypothetical protein